MTTPRENDTILRIAVLTSGRGWHQRDLERAAREVDVSLMPVSWRRLCGAVALRSVSESARPNASARDTNGGEAIVGSDIDLTRVDRVLLRTVPVGSLEQIVLRMDVLQRLEAAGVPVINSPRAMEATVDKYLASARLAAAGLPTPPTFACEDRDDAMRAFDVLGRDVVLKPLFGAEGKGITRLQDADLAYRAFQLLEHHGGVIYLQQFVENDGHDIRAFVLGDRIVAAVRRTAVGGWRANLSLGAKAEPIELSADVARLAVEAARALGAAIAGVDLLPGRDGRCHVLEVNAVPGWRGVAEATGIDVARELLNFVQGIAS